jgi:hypothetical protein
MRQRKQRECADEWYRLAVTVRYRMIVQGEKKKKYFPVSFRTESWSRWDFLPIVAETQGQ